MSSQLEKIIRHLIHLQVLPETVEIPILILDKKEVEKIDIFTDIVDLCKDCDNKNE